MHRVFRQALTDAVGRSEFVIVVVADIRGFSAFSREHESPDTAMYIKRVYSKLIDEYFSTASFYKPTGDGLLVTIPYNERNLSEVANHTVVSCLTCLKQFASICADDNMINFSVPGAIGFGIARGTACCLHSGDSILDYSGHLLNLASRLMNLARPSGLVIDGAFKIELLEEKTRQLFDETEVYVRSLAEDSPMKLYFTKGFTEIPAEAKIPLAREPWVTWTKTAKLSNWPKYGPLFSLQLSRTLKRPNAVKVTLKYQAIKEGRKVKNLLTTFAFGEWKYEITAGQPSIDIQIDKLVAQLEGKIPKTVAVELEVRYVLSPQ
jgi:class 3 adenylate cyclase